MRFSWPGGREGKHVMTSTSGEPKEGREGGREGRKVGGRDTRKGGRKEGRG